MLNEAMDEVILVKGWKKGANWSFPRGKINNKEPDLDCAVREVYEETGYDLRAAGLTGNAESPFYIEVTMREQHMRLYVFRGVPMDTYFEPRTRKEISKVQWYKLSELPTLKKRKQQQEGKGEDLAVNANKFYMVAPFLPHLKKWILQQRKLDKSADSKEDANNLAEIAEGQIPLESIAKNEDVALPSSNDDMKRILEILQQSARPAEVPNLPEVSEQPFATNKLDTQLKNVLGVSSSRSEEAMREPAENHLPTFGPFDNQKANDLLALLQGKSTPKQDPVPQKPNEQINVHSALPKSPPHPPPHPPRFSTLASPSTFPLPSTQGLQDTLQSSLSTSYDATQQSTADGLPQPPQVKAIPAPDKPVQLVPRSSHKSNTTPLPNQKASGQPPAPYQRTGDPRFSQYSQASGNYPPSIPPASKLPPPKLTAQSSVLLNLFKNRGLTSSQPTTASSIEAVHHAAVDSSTEQYNSSPGISDISTPLPHHYKDLGNNAKKPSSESKGTPAFFTRSQPSFGGSNASMPRTKGNLNVRQEAPKSLPSSLRPTYSALKTSENGELRSEHRDKLLSIFRSPPAAFLEPVKATETSLQPPSGLVELSALPSPGHSREPSKVDSTSNQQARKIATNASVIDEKQLGGTHDPVKPPVSATVNGPLKVPQFDVLAKTTKDSKRTPRRKIVQQRKPSPVKIVSRPTDPTDILPAHQSPTRSARKQQKPAAPTLQTFTTPTKTPPTPDLKGQEIPAKPFHPQILRRPAHLEDLNEPSPIQPLPSPKHNLTANRRSYHPADSKKSLLSLLTKPSPTVSPPSAPPGSAVEPATMISPLLEKPKPQDQINVDFSRPMRSGTAPLPSRTAVADASVTAKPFVGSITTNSEKAERFDKSNEKQTPAAVTSPVNRSFLLGYLEGVAKGDR